MSARLFPGDYLDQGSKGPAVNFVGMWMRLLGHDPNNEIQLDGEYTPGGAIVRAVERFQSAMAGSVDGNFGPETRKLFRAKTGIDIDSLTVDMFSGETYAIALVTPKS